MFTICQLLYYIHLIFEQLCEIGTLMIPIFKDELNWGTDRLNKLAQGDTARKWQGWDSNLESVSIMVILLIITLNHYT